MVKKCAVIVFFALIMLCFHSSHAGMTQAFSSLGGIQLANFFKGGIRYFSSDVVNSDGKKLNQQKNSTGTIVKGREEGELQKESGDSSNSEEKSDGDGGKKFKDLMNLNMSAIYVMCMKVLLSVGPAVCIYGAIYYAIGWLIEKICKDQFITDSNGKKTWNDSIRGWLAKKLNDKKEAVDFLHFIVSLAAGASSFYVALGLVLRATYTTGQSATSQSATADMIGSSSFTHTTSVATYQRHDVNIQDFLKSYGHSLLSITGVSKSKPLGYWSKKLLHSDIIKHAGVFFSMTFGSRLVYLVVGGVIGKICNYSVAYFDAVKKNNREPQRIWKYNPWKYWFAKYSNEFQYVFSVIAAGISGCCFVKIFCPALGVTGSEMLGFGV